MKFLSRGLSLVFWLLVRMCLAVVLITPGVAAIDELPVPRPRSEILGVSPPPIPFAVDIVIVPVSLTIEKIIDGLEADDRYHILYRAPNELLLRLDRSPEWVEITLTYVSPTDLFSPLLLLYARIFESAMALIEPYDILVATTQSTADGFIVSILYWLR